jgi:hypothetical protein
MLGGKADLIWTSANVRRPNSDIGVTMYAYVHPSGFNAVV